MHDGVDCRRLRARFDAYLLLAPEEAEAQKIRAHLAVCPACRAALGGYFLLELWEEDGIVPSPDGAGLVRTVMKKLEGGEATPGLSETRISRKKIFSLPLKSKPDLKVSPRRVDALVKSGPPCDPGAKAHDREGNRTSRVFRNYLAAALATLLLCFGNCFKTVADLALQSGRLQERIRAVDRSARQIIERSFGKTSFQRDLNERR